jgi:GWxTD domain-containing protein
VSFLSAVVFGLVLSLLPGAAAATSREVQAAELLRDARARIAVGTPDQRQFARGLLEDAHRLVPHDAEISHALARLYLEADMLFAARRLANACIARDARDAEAHFLLGEMWRREWIVRNEDVTRDRAIVSLARGLRLTPGDPARARMLVPMLEDAHERRSALEVAELAARARPKDPESLLLVGYAAQNAGELTLADQMYQRALPLLDVERRRRYDDLSPLLGEAAGIPYRRLKAAERARFNASFWHGNDPDPTTPEHEAQVEFWARVTHSELLFGMNELGIWDLRAQLYIRYGAPRRIDRSLVSSPVSTQLSTWAAWSYPELGMRIWIPALNPLGHYGSRFGLSDQPWVRAFPDSLRAHPELLSMQGGYAVFRRLPPDTELMPLRTAVVRFDGGAGAVLLAQAEVESAPAGRLRARWVLLDSASTVVSSTTSDVGASACEPSSMRAASFATNVAPGHYRLAVRVDDDAGRCALATQDVVIAAPRSSLAVSDLAVVCGSPAISIVPGSGVRLEPSTGLRPQSGDELLAYVEIYHLKPDPEGVSEFEYVCTVRPVQNDRRSWLAQAIDPHSTTEPIVVTRRERGESGPRRQFFTVPVRALPPGPYQMEVSVTDLHSGASTATLAEFIRH